MYTTKETYKETQRVDAQSVIQRILGLNSSRTRRIQELDEQRDTYQSFGDCQDAINLIEDQMVACGRPEWRGNKKLIDTYDEELRKRVVSYGKEEWDERDQEIWGQAKAYSQARYFLRFFSMPNAVDLLEEEARGARKPPLESNEFVVSTNKAYEQTVQIIIEHLSHLLTVSIVSSSEIEHFCTSSEDVVTLITEKSLQPERMMLWSEPQRPEWMKVNFS